MTDDTVAQQIAALRNMETRALRQEWTHHFRHDPPPRLSRDLLVRGIAWKIQERAYGGLSPATKRRLAQLAEQLAAGGDLSTPDRGTLRPGARLVREWGGRLHSVTALPDGFEYDGRRFRSLSQIAREITGARWSGPRFFGLAGSGENGSRLGRKRP